jgi:hypothetical protein
MPAPSSVAPVPRSQESLERLATLGPVRVRLLLTPTVHENAPSWNVVGEVKGAERPDEIVLIGGHLARSEKCDGLSQPRGLVLCQR